MSLFQTTILSEAGITSNSVVAKTIEARANIVKMSQVAEDAVLRPREIGAFGHELRAALAARVARLSKDDALAEHYVASAGDQVVLADPTEPGTAQGLSTVLAFVDKVSNQTRDIVADDISALQVAGVADDDIVRLCELIAFLAYQIRVVSGLRLMRGDTS